MSINKNKENITFNLNLHGQICKIKHCSTCLCWRPYSSSHCKTCNNCIENFDHHCPWLSNCIGKRNYKFFILFLLILFLMLIINTFILVQLIFHILNNFILPNLVVFFIYSTIVFAFLLVIGILLFFHIYLIFKDITTNESYKSKDKLIKKKKKKILKICYKLFFKKQKINHIFINTNYVN